MYLKFPGRLIRRAAAWPVVATCALSLWTGAASAQDDPPPPPGDPAPPPATAPQDGAVPPDAVVAPGGEVIKERYPNGAVQIERHVIQNERGDYVNHGPFTYFLPDGKRWGGGEFLHGKRHGLWKRWYYRGEAPLFQEEIYAGFAEPFLSEAHFVNGQIDGPWTIHDANKQKVSEWSFHAGVPHGVWTWYYPSGQKLREVA
ncbi:MAG: hypothetical protein KY475_16720, partial [Planctomycetes bacterium]|nr:hypothetical protein [Planctomycetota bacterium]